MEQQDISVNSQNQAAVPSSFMARATDAFASPSNLFSEVAETPAQTTSWLIPFIISIVLGVLFTFSIYNNPALKHQVFETQAQAMKKAVAEGKMTQEQADRFTDSMESTGPALFLVFGIGGVLVWLAVTYFGIALVLWLTAKFALKFAGPYNKLLETFGLSALIGILGGIIALLLVNLYDSLYATPSLALTVLGSFDATKPVHRLLASLNVFTVWQVVVLGIGLGKVTKSSVSTSVGIVFGLWGVWLLASTFLGLGFR
jgi:hypothetical protein